MQNNIIIVTIMVLLCSCQSNKNLESSLTPTSGSPDPQSSALVGLAKTISGNSFRNGARIVTFAQDGTYQFSFRGASTYGKWTVKSENICLSSTRTRCSKFKSKGNDRYGWSFDGRSEHSYEKTDWSPVSSVRPFKDGDSILTTAEALAYLGENERKLPNRWRVSLDSNTKLTFDGPTRSSAATLTEQNGKLCGQFRLGQSSCISVVKNEDRHFVVFEPTSGKFSRRWLVLS